MAHRIHGRHFDHSSSHLQVLTTQTLKPRRKAVVWRLVQKMRTVRSDRIFKFGLLSYHDFHHVTGIQMYPSLLSREHEENQKSFHQPSHSIDHYWAIVTLASSSCTIPSSAPTYSAELSLLTLTHAILRRPAFFNRLNLHRTIFSYFTFPEMRTLAEI